VLQGVRFASSETRHKDEVLRFMALRPPSFIIRAETQPRRGDALVELKMIIPPRPKSDLSDFGILKNNSGRPELCGEGSLPSEAKANRVGVRSVTPPGCSLSLAATLPVEGRDNRSECSKEISRATSYRLLSNIFSLSQFCDRAACKRAKACSGNAGRCLAFYSDQVPREAREFIVDLMTSRELGYSFEEAMRRDKKGAKQFANWSDRPVRKVSGNLTRNFRQ
jgi:hypothetical protein